MSRSTFTSSCRVILRGVAIRVLKFLLVLLCIGAASTKLLAQDSSGAPCSRPSSGSTVLDPENLHSVNGALTVDLSIRNFRLPNGSVRYCYVLPNGEQSPTLRVKPGDLLIIHLTNRLTDFNSASGPEKHLHHDGVATRHPDACLSARMELTSTNLHFHGLSIPSICHQDEVLKTAIPPGSAPFEYRFQIPANQASGLYWYHPHIHGFTKLQVSGGASGALIVEGIERANTALAGLPERVFVIRDQDLLNPNSPPAASEPVVPPMLIDRDGDSANNGTGFGKPAKDLSINYVPVPFPNYPPASIRMKPQERQLWRVLNASAITYLNLAVIFGNKPQKLGIVAIDGAPTREIGNSAGSIEWQDHLGLPPGGRIEFIVDAPPARTSALFVTRTVDTGPGGENDPNRALATVTVDSDGSDSRSTLAAFPEPVTPPITTWLGNVAPVRVRRLYFSEKLEDPNNPSSATKFFITVDGQTPAAFDPSASEPNIVVKQGDVEDWIIENRSQELHAFHIHQVHFLLLNWSGTPVEEPFLRDTVNIPYFNGRTLQYPSVTLRMDFRGPETVGTFPYHCHLLEHEDNGMMGLIRVEPVSASPTSSSHDSVTH